jgi:iron-sulfur cluster assembly accessory protein
MSTAVAPETFSLGLKDAPKSEAPAAPPISVTEKAAAEVKRYIAEMQEKGEVKPDGKLYLRIRTLGGGCSGLQDKLDLEPTVNEKSDQLFNFHGVDVVVDKRSLLYLVGATVDFHDDLNRRGFVILNPNRKGTCGCGSSYSV